MHNTKNLKTQVASPCPDKLFTVMLSWKQAMLLCSHVHCLIWLQFTIIIFGLTVCRHTNPAVKLQQMKGIRFPGCQALPTMRHRVLPTADNFELEEPQSIEKEKQATDERLVFSTTRRKVQNRQCNLASMFQKNLSENRTDGRLNLSFKAASILDNFFRLSRFIYFKQESIKYFMPYFYRPDHFRQRVGWLRKSFTFFVFLCLMGFGFHKGIFWNVAHKSNYTVYIWHLLIFILWSKLYKYKSFDCRYYHLHASIATVRCKQYTIFWWTFDRLSRKKTWHKSEE